MAEKKYNLALVDTVKDKPVKHQDWYKERLQTKYIKQLKPGETVNHHSTQNWLFFKDGLDDFRDGLPPAVNGSDFIKGDKGPGPTIHGEFVRGAVKVPAAKKRLNRQQVYMSRCTPQQQQRREYINEVEQGLLKHPLALYPHLEESVAPERKPYLHRALRKLEDGEKGMQQIKLFEDIVDLLDPQFNIQDMQDGGSLLEELSEKTESSQSPMASVEDNASTGSSRKQEEDRLIREAEAGGVIRNPYRWLPRKDTKDIKKDGKKANKEKEQKGWPQSASEEEHIKNVTQEFCDWVADLGGESNNIEESTITSLFASGYETKPALSVPIHVVELTNVPQELRLSAAVPPSPEKHPNVGERPKQKPLGDYEPSWVKFKFGAWYLNPRTWKKRDCSEPLLDPKQLKDQEMSEAKKKSNVLNQELAQMHASRAFTDFIHKKGTRRPEFLVEVAEIQRKVAEEELRRAEQEQMSKHRKATLTETPVQT